ncbi:LysR family transcriptional regulator [Octadecabacter antarcticus 307]|uniref:LysR family transcriptional regulator n=1 Tax=Octadecabacter antarcticus 307 TaxID=391626 RepID=M9RC30_9RHOB|nr:LysR family transcriptional regulator [Octadecabacter antarcticus]AGI70169.1 LysR family transcriptional regulator [Octadecabacter antarcticus 307]
MNWHDIPSLAALRAFESAARHSSFSAAARDLNVTHAAIGQHVRALEDHFSQSLMQRLGRGMTVTPEGHKLANSLSDAFGLIATASNDLLDQSKTRAIRVALTPSFAANWLMPHIGSFWDQHSEIEVELIPSKSLIDMRSDNIDVAIRYGRGGWAGVKANRLMAAGHVAVAAPSYIAGREVNCLADLKGSRWLLDGIRSEERFWLAENGIVLDEEIVTTFATGPLARAAALAGLGVAVMPAPIAAPNIASGRFVKLCAEHNSGIAYHILTRPGVVSAARDVFVKWLKTEAST